MKRYLIIKRQEELMLKVYGSYICIECRETRDYFEQENIPFELVDITADTTNLREFLRLRDSKEIFAGVRESGMIGIPYFVLGDRETLSRDEAVAWLKD